MQDKMLKELQVRESDKEGLYRVIFSRRDVRREFLPDEIDNETISRILYAAHYAPSVGFMQPWDFVVIRSKETREKVYQIFQEANSEVSEMFDGERAKLYNSLKLEGILDTPVNICVTCDRDRRGSVVLGRTHMMQMDRYSTVCAVENLWLAARAEGLGVGWVSILDEESLKEVLNIPENIEIIAYLCIGKVRDFQNIPDLQRFGWQEREELSSLVHIDSWRGLDEDELMETIEMNRGFPAQYSSN